MRRLASMISRWLEIAVCFNRQEQTFNANMSEERESTQARSTFQDNSSN